MDDDWFYGGVWNWQISEFDANFVDMKYDKTIRKIWPSLIRSRFGRSPAAYREKFSNCTAAMIADGRATEIVPLLHRYVEALSRKGLLDTLTISLLGLAQFLSGRFTDGKETWRSCDRAPYAYRMGYECWFLEYFVGTAITKDQGRWRTGLAKCCRNYGRDVEPLGFILAQVVLGKLDPKTAKQEMRREFEKSEPDFMEAKWLVQFYEALRRLETGDISSTSFARKLDSLGKVKLMTVPFEYLVARTYKQLITIRDASE